jgi:hypothetical protein
MGLEAEIEGQLCRIADSLDLLVKHSAENFLLGKSVQEEQRTIAAETQRILREDLTFRREQAAEAKQQQEFFLKLFMGAQAPPTPSPDGEADPPGLSRVPRRHRGGA